MPGDEVPPGLVVKLTQALFGNDRGYRSSRTVRAMREQEVRESLAESGFVAATQPLEERVRAECAADLRQVHRSSLEARGVVRAAGGRDEAYCVHDGETWPCTVERTAAGWCADPGQDTREEQ